MAKTPSMNGFRITQVLEALGSSCDVQSTMELLSIYMTGKVVLDGTFVCALGGKYKPRLSIK